MQMRQVVNTWQCWISNVERMHEGSLSGPKFNFLIIYRCVKILNCSNCWNFHAKLYEIVDDYYYFEMFYSI